MAPANGKRLKKLLAQFPPHDEVITLLQRLSLQDNHAGDRATAIVGATLIEHGLRLALSAAFIALDKTDIERIFDGNQGGPLATFSQRTLIAYAMGLIGAQSRADIDGIRGIRNIFAHGAFEIMFSHQDVAAVCVDFQLLTDKTLSPKDSYVSVVALCSEQLRKSIPKNIGIFTNHGALTIPNPSRQHLP